MHKLVRRQKHPQWPTPASLYAHIMGLPVLRYESERWKIDLGNATMRFSVSVANVCIQHMVPFAIANPASSMIWQSPSMLWLRNRRPVREAITDLCQWGTPWKKATRMVVGHADPAMPHRRCRRCKGLCSRSRRPHQQLKGTRADCVFWTKIAEVYPRRFATAVADMLFNAAKSIKCDTCTLAAG